jgi:hypothetical protein
MGLESFVSSSQGRCLACFWRHDKSTVNKVLRPYSGDTAGNSWLRFFVIISFETSRSISFYLVSSGNPSLNSQINNFISR